MASKHPASIPCIRSVLQNTGRNRISHFSGFDSAQTYAKTFWAKHYVCIFVDGHILVSVRFHCICHLVDTGRLLFYSSTSVWRMCLAL